ncbi:hypothetical protein [Burkholderia gladioli]|uniref:hypothetical protein n=1 Tax=Burkholderia gladioli TaxID=28095 RepID=UPI001640F0DC|nr:hypothetical protein [Burkholderia gladioli]
MSVSVHGVFVSDPRASKRDGLEFTVTIDGKTSYPCFISGTALRLISHEGDRKPMDIFMRSKAEIGMIISRKVDVAEGEIAISSDDLSG